MSRSARLLHLLQVMRGRHQPVTAARLAEVLEVSERTIYRDVADLMAQGAPIEGEAGVGYILRPGLFLPPLMLSEDEVEAVMLGLRYVDQRGDEVLQAAAPVALAKISAVLSPQAQVKMSNPLSMPGPSRAFPQSATPPDELRSAIRDYVRLDVRYGDEQGRQTERVVWPVQLGFMDRARVLFAWCELRQDFRTFRIDRIITMNRLNRYPGQRAELVRRLRAYLDERSTSPDGNWQEQTLTPPHLSAKEFAMPTDITGNLPKVVADHIAACNAHDIEAWMATFAPDAMLNDIQREFIGTAEIRGFGDKEVFGDSVTMEVRQAWDRCGNITVHAKFDGTYDKTGLPDPLILSLYFSLKDGLITQLIFIHNKTPV
jgi:predicted DNA-binding transcriptional regulator YafY